MLFENTKNLFVFRTNAMNDTIDCKIACFMYFTKQFVYNGTCHNQPLTGIWYVWIFVGIYSFASTVFVLGNIL